MATPPNFSIKPVTTAAELEATKILFTAYATSLGIDLSYQNFSQELASLPGQYTPPTGTLIIALSSPSDVPMGCVALRLLSSPGSTSKNRISEMKRLYCTPSSRGVGVGRALVDQVIKEAARLGYDEIRLDTLSRMIEARKLYEMRGFEEIDAYYDTPVEETVFLSKKLTR